LKTRNAPVVVFDAVCALCCAGLQWIVRHDRRDAAYRLVARNRYRWFGRRPTCYVPAAGEEHRFIAD
jgi:predicted DCC family thiol-disulfide oxidoreductase YuxK